MTIYFIQAGICGPIKIGVTSNLKKRLAKMAVDNHEPLVLLAQSAGDMALEQRAHNVLRGHRYRGEWYKNNLPVTSMVQAAREDSLRRFINDREAEFATRAAVSLGYDADLQSAIKRWVAANVDRDGIVGVANAAGVSIPKVRRAMRDGDCPITDFAALAHASGETIESLLAQLQPHNISLEGRG